MFFLLSKLFWTVAAPGNLLIAAGVGGLLLQWRRRSSSWGLRLSAGAMLGLASIAVFPIGDLVRAPLEDRFPPPASLPAKVDGVVVLGGPVEPTISERRGQATVNDGAERLFALVSFARKYPDAKIVFSGGSGLVFSQTHVESEVVRSVLRDLGENPARVLFESESRNTYENAVFSKRLVEPTANETWLLVTSAYHMPRSMGIFRAVEWPVIPWPVDYRTGGLSHLGLPLNLSAGLTGLEIASREWIGLAVYWITGRSASLFPGP